METFVGEQEEGVCAASQQRCTRVKVIYCQGLVMEVVLNVCKCIQNGEVIDRINQHTCIMRDLGFSHR